MLRFLKFPHEFDSHGHKMLSFFAPDKVAKKVNIKIYEVETVCG